MVVVRHIGAAKLALEAEEADCSGRRLFNESPAFLADKRGGEAEAAFALVGVGAMTFEGLLFFPCASCADMEKSRARERDDGVELGM